MPDAKHDATLEAGKPVDAAAEACIPDAAQARRTPARAPPTQRRPTPPLTEGGAKRPRPMQAMTPGTTRPR